MIQSMSRVGKCIDNGPMEGFWGTLKSESFYGLKFNDEQALLNKIERRLGTRALNLPDYLTKDKWATEVIENETLDTFSRYFPNSMKVNLDLSQKKKEGYYFIIMKITV